MLKYSQISLSVLLADPDLSLCHVDDSTNPPTVHVHTLALKCDFAAESVSQQTQLPVVVHHGVPLRTLLDYPPDGIATNPHQVCQDEPVKLGTQIQPARANWVGTAGAPVRWKDPSTGDRWGILSNWHVMVPHHTVAGHTQHQPFTDRPAVAKLTAWSPVYSNEVNTLDAAIADAHVDGKHTIGRAVIGIGELSATPLRATVGLAVVKAGRTTGVTRGVCVAVHAAARVDYGDWEAVFADQDVYADVAGSFAAAGDSGSAIAGEACKCLTGLLFAGGGGMTVACPIRYAQEKFGLLFPTFP